MAQPSSASFRSVINKSVTSCGVNTEVGSSIINSFGFCIKQRMISTLWRAPTDKSPTTCCGLISRPYCFEYLIICSVKSVSTPISSRPSMMFSATVKDSNNEKCWNTIAIPCSLASKGLFGLYPSPHHCICPLSACKEP